MRDLSTIDVSDRKSCLGWISCRVRKKALEIMGKRGKIAALGCGNGLFLAMLGLKGWDTSKIFGLDISEESLKEAEKILARNAVSGVHLTRGDFYNTPFKNDTFEAIVLLNVTCNLEDEEFKTIIKEMVRILAPDGKICVDIRNADNPMMRWRNKREKVYVRGYRLNDVVKCLKNLDLNISRIDCIGLNSRYLALSYILEIEKGKRT